MAWMAWGALLAGLAVAAGAFGAHGLEGRELPAENGHEVFETAVRYQMYHALALVGLGAFQGHLGSRRAQLAGWAFLLGIAVFSGMLYAYVFTGIKWLGAIVPIGGVSFIVGWGVLAYAAWQARQPGPPVQE